MSARNNYEELLLQFFDLRKSGQKESPEAEHICEQLDEEWVRMTAEEQEETRRFAASLLQQAVQQGIDLAS